MNDQQRSTPQPFDDGPRSTVDPHLLPAVNRTQRAQAEDPAPMPEASLVADTTDTGDTGDLSEAADTGDAGHANDTVQASDTRDTIDPSEFIAEEQDAGEPSPVTEESASTPSFEAETESVTGEAAPEIATDDTPIEEADVTLTTEPGSASEPGRVSEPGSASEPSNASNRADSNDAADVGSPAAATLATDTAAPETAAVPEAAASESTVSESTGRSRLDEALERSRTIPYEAPVPPAAEEEDAASVETAVVDTELVEATETETHESTDAISDADALAEEERRRDDEAFEDAMLGTASTEGLIVPPTKRGNRTFALVLAVITTIVFAALYAFAFSTARFIFTPGADILGDAWAFAGTAAFYVPVAVFAVVMILWSVISNRAGWWSYILASVLLAFLAFGGHYVGIAAQDVINGGAWSNQALFDAIRGAENLPGALIAFIAARESANWVGGLIAARGRRVIKLNQRDQADYERRVAEERELSAITSPASLESN
ncbi:hypothetical protein [Gulosibacter chungangensis]|uniref:Uncharacterized protein n=1 Tax=Gulosibacter chungangensis TaxID=979746 RepID=A0A7J5BFK9_9MICO|nr:hypothetical protein [Gulosibacter chungangensis]KAB1644712.1 hypothetical protein F8O05_00050 [Gulosibacter chungangensis]